MPDEDGAGRGDTARELRMSTQTEKSAVHVWHVRLIFLISLFGTLFYRSRRLSCSHFGKLLNGFDCRLLLFTEVDGIPALTSVIASCSTNLPPTIYRSNRVFGGYFRNRHSQLINIPQFRSELLVNPQISFLCRMCPVGKHQTLIRRNAVIVQCECLGNIDIPVTALTYPC